MSAYAFSLTVALSWFIMVKEKRAGLWKCLKDCGVFYFTTAEWEQPLVRPLYAVHLFERRLYIR